MWFSTLTLISNHVIFEVGMITVLYHIQAFSEMRLETICTVSVPYILSDLATKLMAMYEKNSPSLFSLPNLSPNHCINMLKCLRSCRNVFSVSTSPFLKF